MKKFLAEYGERLLARGYNIVPIPPGEKGTTLKSWTSLKADNEHLQKWLGNGYSNAGVGVQTKHSPAVDIDVYDKDCVNKLLTWCEENIGVTVTRVGQEPKTLMVYRCEKPFKKVQSSAYEDWLGNLCRVEILGDGQQFVAFAYHPDTKKPYVWNNGEGISNIDVNDLPVITEQQAIDLCDYFESIAEEFDLELKQKKTRSLREDDNPGLETRFRNFSDKTTISDEKIKEVLSYIDPSEYDHWFTVGCGLWHQFDGDEQGFTTWDNWSQLASNYDADVMRRHWDSFEPDYLSKPLTFRGVIHLAKEYGYVHKGEVLDKDGKKYTLKNFMQQYAYVVDGNQVCDLNMVPYLSLMKFEEFKNYTSNVRHEVDAPTVKEPDRTKMEAMYKTWLIRTDRHTARGTDYLPGGKRVLTKNGLKFVNLYYAPEFKEVEVDLGRIRRCLDHLDYLIPDEEERTWFIGFMARMMQKPAERSPVAALHVSEYHGTGRGWIVRLLERLVGPWNASRPKMSVFAGEGSAGEYQDHLYRKRLYCIEETKESAKKQYTISDKVRDFIDSDRLDLNLKYGGKISSCPIFAYGFMMSNHPDDAIVLPAEDRRIYVLTGPDHFKDKNYYDALYAWLCDHENLRHFYWYLMNLDISELDFSRSAETKGRTRLIEANRSDTERLFDEFMKSEKREELMTFEEIELALYSLSDKSAMDTEINKKQLKFLLRKFCYQHAQVMVEGERARYWQTNRKAPLDKKECKVKLRQSRK